MAQPDDFSQSVSALLEMYKENIVHGRHLETQRQLITGFVIALTGAVVAALATMKFQYEACRALGLVLIGAGFMGTAFAFVQYGKWTKSRSRWRG